MRYWAVAAFALGACNQQGAKAPAHSPRVAFDGAGATATQAKLAHGERLTYVLGCRGCHGTDLRGEQFEPKMTQYGPIYASNLTVEVPAVA